MDILNITEVPITDESIQEYEYHQYDPHKSPRKRLRPRNVKVHLVAQPSKWKTPSWWSGSYLETLESDQTPKEWRRYRQRLLRKIYDVPHWETGKGHGTVRHQSVGLTWYTTLPESNFTQIVNEKVTAQGKILIGAWALDP